jgi:hypothetical protein
MTPDEILKSKGFITLDATGALMALGSWDGFSDFSGICRRGPYEGYTLTHNKPIAKIHKGAYRHLDNKWWWTPAG